MRLSDVIAPVFRPVWADIRAERHTEYWMKGGRGGGKSSYISLKIPEGMMRDPEKNAIVYRRYASTLRESVYEQMIWGIETLGVRKYWDFRLSPMEIRYKPTGQRILFRGADDPTKSKSIKLSRGYFGYLWFEELTEFRGIEDIASIKASVLRGNGHSVTFCSYNPPKTAQNWVNAEALVPRADRLVFESSYLDIPRAWLGERFIAEAEAMRATNERAYRHTYLGEVNGTGGQVFDNLKIRKIDAEELNGLSAFYCGQDFGFAVDPDAFVRWGYSQKARAIYAVSEFYGAHNTTDTLAERIKGLSGGETVRCDSEDPRMIRELQIRGVKAAGVKKGPGSVAHGMRWLQDMGQIVIDPARTPNIVREFQGYEYEQDRNGNFLAEFPDVNNHTIDATRYALEPLIGQKKLKTMDKNLLGL